MTMDATDPVHPNGIHPNQHVVVVKPNDPLKIFERIGRRRDPHERRVCRRLVPVRRQGPRRATGLSRCRQLLSRVPTLIESLNKGLSTLQFQSLSVDPSNANVVQGGTQDNGTWQTTGNPVKWTETMIGDGGQSGFES